MAAQRIDDSTLFSEMRRESAETQQSAESRGCKEFFPPWLREAAQSHLQKSDAELTARYRPIQ